MKAILRVLWAFLNCLFLKSKPLHRLMANKKGAGGVVAVLISTAIMLLVGILICNALINSQTPDDTWSTDANNTWTAVQSYLWISMSLCAIGLLVIGAVSIMSYLKV